MAIEPGISNIQCRIYQPPKSSMQSGRAKTHSWMLEYEIETARRPEPLMGWTASGESATKLITIAIVPETHGILSDCHHRNEKKRSRKRPPVELGRERPGRSR